MLCVFSLHVFLSEAFISLENDYATTNFKLRELEIMPYLGITFGSRSLTFVVAESFHWLLKTFTEKRSSSVAPSKRYTRS